jgi:hypothetical protein
LSWHPREDLSALIDGELPPAEAATVRRHLEVCVECRREARQLTEARDRLRALGSLTAPPGLDLVVGRRVRWMGRLAAVSAAAAGLVAAALLWVSAPAPTVPAPDLTADGVVGTALTLSAAEIPPGYLAPGSVDGLALAALRRRRTMLEADYGSGGEGVVVLEERGRLAGRDNSVLDGHAGLMRSLGERSAFTMQLPDLVVTLVGEPDAVMAGTRSFVRAAPAGPWTVRARILCRTVVEDLTGS